MIRTLTLMLCLALAAGGCARLDTAQDETETWSCGVPHCHLYPAPGLRMIDDGGSRQLVHEETGVRVQIGYLDAGEAPTRLDALFADQRAALGLAADWSQAPQHPSGFVVRGLTGTALPPAGMLIDADPRKVWFASYLNANTGSVLTLRMTAPSSVWDQAWTAFEPVLTRVVFTSAF